MREIEFRGKRCDNGNWAKGSLLCWKDGTRHICEKDSDRSHLTRHSVCNRTVGQYTDLKDKDGNKIFEGDIVLYKKMKLPVRWDNEKAGFFIGNDRYWMMNDTDIEVIGNIHDNPELLEGIKEEDQQ